MITKEKVFGISYGDIDFDLIFNNRKKLAKYQLYHGSWNIANFDTEEKGRLFMDGMLRGFEIIEKAERNCP